MLTDDRTPQAQSNSKLKSCNTDTHAAAATSMSADSRPAGLAIGGLNASAAHVETAHR